MTKLIDLPKQYKRYKRTHLPKGVYSYDTEDGPRYLWESWEKGSSKRTGSKGGYSDPEAASYDRKIHMYGHHWDGMPEDLTEFFGFTYRLTEKSSGRMYLGAKQFYYWDGPVKGYKCTAPADEDWDPTLWKDGEWQTYASSSKVVKDLVGDEPWRFDFEVTALHRSKLELFHSELKEQIEADVLNAVDADGNYVYLNEQIMGVEYRPVVPKAKLKAAREEAQAKIKAYYLRPMVCEDCGTVIPYGERMCPNADMFGTGGCNERAANG